MNAQPITPPGSPLNPIVVGVSDFFTPLIGVAQISPFGRFIEQIENSQENSIGIPGFPSWQEPFRDLLRNKVIILIIIIVIIILLSRRR